MSAGEFWEKLSHNENLASALQNQCTKRLVDVNLSNGIAPARDDDNFSQLIVAARSGDRDALGTLVEECRDYLLLIANQDLDSQLQAKLGGSDLVQESMLTAQACFEDFHGHNQAEFVAWIRQILKNDLRDAHRRYRGVEKRHVQREMTIDDSANAKDKLKDQLSTPSTQAMHREQAALLAQSMASLPIEYQQVLQLRNWEQLSYEEIGQRMERSSEAARKLWGRAIVGLRNEMRNE